MKTWEERQRPIEKATERELYNALYDWHCCMANSFSGTPFPSDFPLNKEGIHYSLEGKHLSFFEFKRECGKRGVKLEGVE